MSEGAGALQGRLRGADVVPLAELVEIFFEGRALPAYEDETVAAALTAAGILGLRRAQDGRERGVFCGMGVCFECLVRIDGRLAQRACMTKVRAGMRIVPHDDRGPAPDAHDPALAPAPDSSVLERNVDVLVVGAGPAGLAAAEAAARAGAQVTIVDERPAPGGQYYKQLAPGLRPARSGALDAQFARGFDLIRRVTDLGVDLATEAMVWNASWRGAGDAEEPAIEVAVLRQGRAVRYRARRLVVATGAYERAHRVPGWTLPGFMTTGAAQTLGRAYRVAPGRRILLAGNGPLNLQVACELATGGVEVVAVAESAGAPRLADVTMVARALRLAPDLMRDGVRYLWTLRRRRIPLLYRHILLRADGERRVERATLVAIDADGTAVPGSERIFKVDAVCVGYGFLPVSEITRLLGCEHRYDRQSGGLVVVRDEDGATTRQGVLAVGDCTGRGGARVALAEGALAGWRAARELGRSLPQDAERAAARARRDLRRHRRFQTALWSLFAAPAALDTHLDDDALVCRCEGVGANELKAAIAAGADEIGALKRLTRVGMGRCQGRYCGAWAARRCMEVRGGAVLEPMDFFAPRFPIKPVPAVALAREHAEWSDAGRGVDPPEATRPRGPRERAGARPEAEVAIIGAGILGVCTAYHLARAGFDVAILERGQPNGEASGNNAGSLHVQLLAYDFGDLAQGSGRAAAETLPLQRESARLWPELARAVGADLELAVTGGLMIAEDVRRLDHLRRKAALERRYGTSVEVIGTADVLRMAPTLCERIAGAAWCPEEGKINPLLAGPAVLEGALTAGARLFKETEVQAIEREGAAFLLHTCRGPLRVGKILNACGGWASRIAAMVGARLPTRAHPIQLIVTEPAPPLIHHLLAYADRHLTMKQMARGNLIIGGGWRAAIDPGTGRPSVLCESVEGNLWVAQRILPALRSLHILRTWAAVNVNIDGAPILGELPGVPGFFNAVSVNGVTLGPIIGQLTADMIRTGKAGRALAPFLVTRFDSTML